MKHIAAFFVLTFLVRIGLHAQSGTVQGVVIDEKTSEPLFGATVSLPDNTRGTATDFNGAFTVELPAGSQTLKVSYLGYEIKEFPVTVVAGQSVEKTLRLTQEGINLGTVVVTSSQYGKDIAQETVSMDVLDEKIIENSNSRDLGEALTKTPGVQVQDGQVNIRGGSFSYGVGSRVAVLVDGNTMQVADTREADLKFAPLENVEQIEVIKGASSVVYGSSALNGVVNVRTAWPTDTVSETEITTYFGVFANPRHSQLIWWDAEQPNFSGVFLNHKQKLNRNVSLVAGANIDMINSYLEENNEFRVRASNKLKIRAKRIEGLNYGFATNLMWENSDRFFISQGMGDDAYRIFEGSGDRYMRSAVSPFLTFVRGNHRLRVDINYFNRWRNGAGDDINQSSNGLTVHPQYQFTLRRGNIQYVSTVGLPVEYAFSRSNLYQALGWVTSYNLAGYYQGEVKYKKLSLVAGLRYEYANQENAVVKGLPIFRSGLNFQAGKATWLRASWGQGFRIPSIGETRIIEDLVDGIFVLPNIDLQTERSWNLEMGVKQGFQIGSFTGYVDLALFWQEFSENLIEYRLGVHPNVDPLTREPYPFLGDQEPLITLNDEDDISNQDEVSYYAGLKPFNVEQARVAGYELGIGGKGTIGPVEIRSLIGYTYNFPANLNDDSEPEALFNPEIQPGDPDNRNIGNYMGDFFRNMFRRMEGEETNKLLQFRPRHVLVGDIEFNYKKFSVGYALRYYSFPERTPTIYYALFGITEGTLGVGQLLTPLDQLPELARENDVTLINYIDRHEQGDWVMDARVAYEPTDKVRLSIIAKNLTNRIYSVRPGRLEPPLNFTLQAKFRF